MGYLQEADRWLDMLFTDLTDGKISYEEVKGGSSAGHSLPLKRACPSIASTGVPDLEPPLAIRSVFSLVRLARRKRRLVVRFENRIRDLDADPVNVLVRHEHAVSNLRENQAIVERQFHVGTCRYWTLGH